MKKSIAILLALLMMAGTLGCSSENVQEKEAAQSDTTSSIGETEAQESETEEETEASVFAGIEEKKFDGRNFNFLYRTTEEYRRMLSEECTTIEDNIKLHQQVLGELQSDIRLAERRVKGLTTMVSNLEKQKTEKETLLSAAEYNLKENKGNAAELAIQIQMLEKELQGIIRQLADKQEKLQTADRQLIELKKDMGAIEERTEELKEEAYQYSRDVHSKVDSLFKDVLLESVISEYRNASAQMNVSERQLFDGSLVQSIAERGTEIMHCATMLFLGMVDDATTFAESHGGGGGGSDLKWGRDEDEDNRAWALRCMRMASRMMRSTIGKKSKR